MVTRIKREN